MMMAEPDDVTLVQRGLAGDKTAVSLLIQRYQARVRRVLRTMLADPADVEDVLQEAFLRAYLGLDTLQQPERFRAWVCGIAINLARMQVRAPARGWLSWDALEAAGMDVVDGRPTPERAAEQQEQARRLQTALADLPPAEREALLLVYWQGLSHRETAVSLGASVAAIKVRVHRGRARLQSALQAEYGAAARPPRPPATEVMMISVHIHDVLARVTQLDARLYLQPILDLLPAAAHEEFLADVTLSMGHGMKAWEQLQTLPEDKRHEVNKLLSPLLSYHVVLLKEVDGQRILPIWIGAFEAKAIALKLKNDSQQRPITHDLLATLLALGGAVVTQAAVSRVHETIFYGTLAVRLGQNGETVEVDCRPSDALSLAVRLDVPIVVAPEIMAQQAMLPDADGRYQSTTMTYPDLTLRSLYR